MFYAITVTVDSDLSGSYQRTDITEKSCLPERAQRVEGSVLLWRTVAIVTCFEDTDPSASASPTLRMTALFVNLKQNDKTELKRSSYRRKES